MEMKWSLKLGRIAGIKVSVHWTFMILLVWIFILHYRLEQDMMQGILGVVFILALFLCVTLHEFGHALTAKRYDINTKSITLLPIGGLARLEKFPEKPMQELLVAIAGPLVNLVIGVFILLVLLAFNSFPSFSEPMNLMNFSGVGFWYNLLFANMILAIFNLIPAFPMDGGRILRALLLFKFERGKATKIAAGIGQFLAIGFVFLGLYANIFLVFIGIFIYLGAGAEAEMEMTKTSLTGYKVKDILMKQFARLSPRDNLGKAVELLLDGQAHDFVIVEEGKVLGILSRNDLIKGLSEKGNSSPVTDAMQTDFLSLDPEMPLQEVYQQILEQSISVAPVVQNGELLGIIDKENIYEFILVNEAMGKKMDMKELRREYEIPEKLS
ncbi:site-2 protease family protein [Salegentibacter flavus]|uniref:Zinc metalloprotease n=1 Tax=Salegentibacter flavus TaxID=287099 RepID=A0A1I4YZG5_9FLAO|nr:site-2 protease family protein [Salegentibacter flavus]SFN43404.1 Zn-dependent protease (includes SpoIVFB) [Salegentibacter flavus]